MACLAAVLMLASFAACGGGPNTTDVVSDVPGEVFVDTHQDDVGEDGLDELPSDAGSDADAEMDGFDSMAEDLVDSDESDSGSDASPDSDIEVFESCTALTVDSDCVLTCAEAQACQVCSCNTDVSGGRCELVTAENGTECEDGENCTRDDYCENGTCVPGRLACDCVSDSDCASREDGNLCNGTLFCDRGVFPHKCAVNPATVVPKCPTDNDTQCLAAGCVPETGVCEMLPANEGQTCTIVSTCILVATCQEGECAAFSVRDCNDNNPCTDDQCVEQLGCVRLPNSVGCDDGNLCTTGDICMDGECGHTGTLDCDNGKFCDGPEGCEPSVGCVPGTPPSCDDGVSCTLDRCLAFYDRCFNDWLPEAIEGPRGAPQCSDGKDNDCDGVSDVSEPECLLGINRIEPDNGVLGGGDLIAISGNSLDLVQTVTIAGKPAEIVAQSNLSLTVRTPPGDLPGRCDVEIRTSLVPFVSEDAFTYTTVESAPQGSCILVFPSQPVERDLGASIVVMQGQSNLPPSVEASVVRFSFGYGPRGSNPPITPGWKWTEATLVASGSVGGLVRTDWSAFPVAVVGGYFDMAARMSVDGGVRWIPCDLDGSANGYLPVQAPDLTVFGNAEPGDIVINEMMWPGTTLDVNDEWIELRNLSDAPIRLDGWKITGVGYPSGQDFLFDGHDRVVRNTSIEGGGYFLIAQFDAPDSVLDAQPDILAQASGSSLRTLRLGNVGPKTYHLVDHREVIIDSAYFSTAYGMIGSIPFSEPFRSMERKADPGDGTTDADWFTAFVSDGWDGDPFQSMLVGTPRAPNSDIATCATDADCQSFHAEIIATLCQKRVCDLEVMRCDIVDIPEGGGCDDGLFCTVGETCTGGTCGGGGPRNCSDTGSQALCTIDSCDEAADVCIHTPDLTVFEGPRDSPSCRDVIDNDCDGMTDGQDIQCLLDVSGVQPDVVPVRAVEGGWAGTISGMGFAAPLPLVAGVVFRGPGGELAAESFVVVDVDTIEVEFPSVGQPGLYDVLVSDGDVTAVLEDAVLFYGTSDGMLARIASPTDAISVKKNQATPYIKARVTGQDIGSGSGMISPSSIIAQIGYGPELADPSADKGWTWISAQYDSTCPDCVDEYQFRLTLSIAAPGVYAVAARFSVDQGITWAWGTIGPYSGDPWDPAGALTVTVLDLL